MIASNSAFAFSAFGFSAVAAWFSLIIEAPFQPAEPGPAAAWPVFGSTVKCILQQVNV
jgi:hypothetical protein